MKKKSSSVKRKNLKNSIFNPQNRNKRIKKIYERFEFLIKQKQCCGNGCHMCPYKPKHIKGSSKLRLNKEALR